MLFERCTRAVEGGTVELAWSAAAGRANHPALDVHWLAALANPAGVGGPWLHVAQQLFTDGKSADGFAAACRGIAATATRDRAAAIAELTPSWRAAQNATPINDAQAFDAGLAAASDDNLPLAVQHLRWAAACEPGNAKRAQGLAVALARQGAGLEAVRVLSTHERADAPRLIGRVLLEAGRHTDATMVLRYAARRFRSSDDWETLACAASRADNDAVCIEAGRKALALGAKTPQLLEALATSLFRLGEFVECEEVAKQLITSGSEDVKVVGLHAMARALAGQGRHVDAHPYAKAAGELGPNGELATLLIETMDSIIAQTTPPIRQSAEHSMERRAYDDLERGEFESLAPAITSPSWGIARVALAASEFRKDEESAQAISPRALEAAIAILSRTEGAIHPEAVLARVRALRIRDNAFIQIDPPPPLGKRLTPAEFDRAYAERDRRPHRPSAIYSAAR
jgi:Flp pilus assembly protein TadD